jgi:hypothetical protein
MGQFWIHRSRGRIKSVRVADRVTETVGRAVRLAPFLFVGFYAGGEHRVLRGIARKYS